MANLSKINVDNDVPVVSSPVKCETQISKNDEQDSDDVPPLFPVDAGKETKLELSVNGLQKKTDDVPLDLRPLSDFTISIDAIEPANRPPIVVMDDPKGLKIILHFASNRPREDVSVIVITTMNQNVKPITEYIFDASISKVCWNKCFFLSLFFNYFLFTAM